MISVFGAVTALGAGVAGLVVDGSLLAVTAGTLGLLTGIAAAALASRLHVSDGRIAALAADNERLREEVDVCATLLESRDLSSSSPVGSYAETAPRDPLDVAIEKRADSTSENAEAIRNSRRRHPASGAEVNTSPLGSATDNPRHPEVPFDVTSREDAPCVVGEAEFGVLLRQRVAAARRALHPLSVIVFAVDENEVADPKERAADLDRLAYTVLDTLRECDSVARVNDLMLAAILDGAAEHGAVWAVERVRLGLLEGPDDAPTGVAAGIACYPTHALDAVELVSAAGRALEAARTRGHSRVQIAES